jgi:hypothetical protein
MSSYWRPQPKICENWRSSSPFRRRSSPHEPPRPSFASLTAALHAQRCRQENGFFNEIRKYRSFVDGVVKGANRPFDALQDPPSERQEARESGLWLKASVAPGGSIAGQLETSASGPRFRDIPALASGVRFSPLGEARRLLCSCRCNTPTASAPPGPRRGASFTISAARSCCLRDV